MGRIVLRNQPCKKCSSSDARQDYEDGLSHCFSCKKTYKTEGQDQSEINPNHYRRKTLSVPEILAFPSRGNAERLLLKNVAEFYGVRVSYGEDGEITDYYYPFAEVGGNETVGFKIKNVADKKSQMVVGEAKNLFGIEHFSNGGKRIIITEGEEDTMAVQTANYKRWKRFFPVVSMGGVNATKYLTANRETLRKFEEIILWFDSDQQGRDALKEASFILGYDKVKVVNSTYKDANDVLKDKGIKEGTDAILNLVFDAKEYQPAGIITDPKDLWSRVTDYAAKPSIPYPESMRGLNEKLKGIRLGEISLFISGTGAGKSSITREILYHILDHTKELEEPPKIGLVALEDDPAESARALAGLAINRNPKAEEIPLDELKVGFDKVFGEGRVMVLDHSGAITDNTIIEQIEYMALQGVKYVILDHLTILISEGVEGKSGLEAQDYMMNQLLRVVKKHNLWIGLVSHLRKSTGGQSFEEGVMPGIDDVRGSGSTKQISFDIIAFARNTIAEKEAEKNTIKLRVLKCRYTGLTGDAGRLRYDYLSGRLTEAPPEDFELSDEFELIE